VLESETLRLLRRHLIEPLACEVGRTAAGRAYRLDVALTANAAMEVDGFAYHSSPEAKAHDEERRIALRLGGLFLLVYTWRHIRFDGRRVIAEVRSAIRDHP
jgi:very-short-patch-repair endonuclease